jgi:predicted Zn-dependent protease
MTALPTHPATPQVLKLDLSQPFAKVLAAVRSLRNSNGSADENEAVAAHRVTEALRRLYEAANGRQVQTVLGPVAIAPAVAPWLKQDPLEIRSDKELLDLVAAVTSNPLAGSNGVNQIACSRNNHT